MRKISSVSRKNFDPPPSVGSEILYLEQKCTISLETIHKINKIFSEIQTYQDSESNLMQDLTI